MSLLDLARRLASAPETASRNAKGDPAPPKAEECSGTLPVAVGDVSEPAAWLLYSRRLGLELWLVRDAAALELIRDELLDRPLVFAEELDRLRPLDTATLGVVLEAKAVFGPAPRVVDPPPGDRERARRT